MSAAAAADRRLRTTNQGRLRPPLFLVTRNAVSPRRRASKTHAQYPLNDLFARTLVDPRVRGDDTLRRRLLRRIGLALLIALLAVVPSPTSAPTSRAAVARRRALL